MLKKICRRCGGDRHGTRSCLVWAVMILVGVIFFPVGLLIFLAPQYYECTKCGRGRRG